MACVQRDERLRRIAVGRVLGEMFLHILRFRWVRQRRRETHVRNTRWQSSDRRQRRREMSVDEGEAYSFGKERAAESFSTRQPIRRGDKLAARDGSNVSEAPVFEFPPRQSHHFDLLLHLPP